MDEERGALLVALRYVIGMSPIRLVAVSAIIESPDTRLMLWASAVTITIAGLAAQILRPDQALEDACRITESTAELFGLLTIIVLGEVVVYVVHGLSEASRSGRTIATGIVSLVIGLGFWWNYFDFVGRRPPRPGALTRGMWNSPIILAAALAATLSLVWVEALARHLQAGSAIGADWPDAPASTPPLHGIS